MRWATARVMPSMCVLPGVGFADGVEAGVGAGVLAAGVEPELEPCPLSATNHTTANRTTAAGRSGRDGKAVPSLPFRHFSAKS